MKMKDYFQEQQEIVTAQSEQVGGTHYLEMKVEPWDVIDSWSQSERIGFYRGNAIKYIMRMGKKDGDSQEIRKALHYLEKLIETLEGGPSHA